MTFYQHKSYIKWILREFTAWIESSHMPVRLHPILSCSASPPAPDVPEELWILKSVHTTDRENIKGFGRVFDLKFPQLQSELCPLRSNFRKFIGGCSIHSSHLSHTFCCLICMMILKICAIFSNYVTRKTLLANTLSFVSMC